MSRVRSFIGCAFVVAAVLGGSSSLVGASARSQPTVGTTITVTTLADDNTVNGNCSLREALQAANTDHTVDACPAGNGADTIKLGAHTYAVTKGELAVSSSVTIRGAPSLGVTTTINGRQPECVGLCQPTFHVSSGGHLTISAIIFKNAGNGIRNDGHLNLALVAYRAQDGQICGGSDGNVVRALDNRGVATVSQVSIEYSPGAIANAVSGTLAIDHLSMSYNGSCGDFGASITNHGSMTLRDAEFFGDLFFLGQSSSIHNFGTIAIDHVSFDHNSGSEDNGILYNVGTASIARSAFDENQMLAIRNAGTLTLRQSRITANDARRQNEIRAPAAVFNEGRIAINDSTIDHNTGLACGAVCNRGSDAQATLVNVTIANNLTQYVPPRPPNHIGPDPLPSGGITNEGVMMVRNSTITANEIVGFRDWRYHAGGVVTMPNAYTALTDSIISDNHAAAPVAAQGCFGAIHSLGYNLIDDPTQCFIGAVTTGNVIGVSAHLRPLGDNGGGTMTAFPPWDSPVVDAGNAATPNNSNAIVCALLDQRGFTRPRDGNADGVARCDIGAVER